MQLKTCVLAALLLIAAELAWCFTDTSPAVEDALARSNCKVRMP
jgi:hypothetical protein